VSRWSKDAATDTLRGAVTAGRSVQVKARKPTAVTNFGEIRTATSCGDLDAWIECDQAAGGGDERQLCG